MQKAKKKVSFTMIISEMRLSKAVETLYPKFQNIIEKIEGEYSIYILPNNGLCYVGIPKTHKLNNHSNYRDIPIKCHGGLTFAGKRSFTDKWCFGWDYLHLGDEFPPIDYLHNEAKDVINQLKILDR